MNQTDGSKRIDALGALIHSVRARSNDCYEVDPSGFDEGPELVPDQTDAVLRKDLARAIRIIEVSRGRGGPATFQPQNEATAHTIIDRSHAVWNRLCEADGNRLGNDEIAQIVGNDDLERNVKWVLKSLQLAGGIRKAGGLQPYENIAAEAEEASRELDKVVDQIERDEQEEERHESVYYEPVADVLSKMGFATSVLGVRRRGVGQWSTPDVVGIQVREARYLVTPIVRIATVEVKHYLDRVGIAEAAAHRRFAHYSYLAVRTPLADLDPVLVTACLDNRIGLICPRNRQGLAFHVHSDPPIHHPDEEEVEWLLGSFRDEQERLLGEIVFEQVRAAFAVLFRT